MAQKYRQTRKTQKSYEELTKIKHPRRNSVIFAIIDLVLVFVLAIIIFLTTSNSFTYTLNVSSGIGAAIAILWCTTRYLFQSQQRWFKNKQNSNLARSYKFKYVAWNADDFRTYQKTKSWWGPIILGSGSVILFIITLIILQTT